MAKKIKYGTIDFPDSEFDEEKALFRISLMLPLKLVKDLRKLSLNETYGGKYQVLIRSVLLEYAANANKKGKKKKTA
jgi:hypothetical protein